VANGDRSFHRGLTPPGSPNEKYLRTYPVRPGPHRSNSWGDHALTPSRNCFHGARAQISTSRVALAPGGQPAAARSTRGLAPPGSPNKETRPRGDTDNAPAHFRSWTRTESL